MENIAFPSTSVARGEIRELSNDHGDLEDNA